MPLDQIGGRLAGAAIGDDFAQPVEAGAHRRVENLVEFARVGVDEYQRSDHRTPSRAETGQR